MTLPVWQGLAAQESSGDIVVLASPSVTVTDKATGAQPNLFSDRAGNTGIGNPFTANADGSIEFYVAPGRYKVEATKGGQTVTWDNQLIGTVHGAEHLWKLATVEIITVAGNASSPTDDAYSADLGGNLSADDTFIGRVANRNETTTPTFENTGGTPGALTITAYDGRPLWPGALEGDHRFQYEAGTSPETWLVLDPNDMGVVNPEHATDSATDTYVSATNTTPPADGVKITRDFQSANTTTTPTLDGKTMTTRDGSALWVGAVSGPHELQYDLTADTYLVLEPNPSEQTDPILYSEEAVIGHVSPPQISNNSTDSDHDIDIEARPALMRDGAGNRKSFSGAALTKQIDANWAEGSAAGGFPSGLTLSADTDYNVFLIGKDNGSVDAGFDTSATATNLLADASAYSWFRRIGSAITDGSSNILGFTQTNDRFILDTPVNDADANNPGTSAVTLAVTAPANQTAILNTHLVDSDPNRNVVALITPLSANDTTPDATEFTLFTTNVNDVSGISVSVATIEIPLNGSQQLRYRLNTSDTGIDVRITTMGWIDDRGRDQ